MSVASEYLRMYVCCRWVLTCTNACLLPVSTYECMSVAGEYCTYECMSVAGECFYLKLKNVKNDGEIKTEMWLETQR